MHSLEKCLSLSSSSSPSSSSCCLVCVVWGVCVCEHVCGVCGVCVRVVDDRVRVCASEVLGYLKQEELLSKKKIFPRGKNFFPKRRTSFHV